MDYIADLHIHSPFSRATSKTSTLAGLCGWAQAKGIQLLGTGDFTHPGWLQQLKNQLVEAEPGFFRLKDQKIPAALPGLLPRETPVRFLLTAEISSIYKRHGQVRKVHNILFAPDFESVERIVVKLAGIGNIEADGRPILGLDSRDLLEIVLEQAPGGFLVPAHIWTPWFSLFGSKSGFDTVEECFGDLAGHIFALETGLSSDPEMNRLISALDRYALISNSDCHSPGKLGREANLFETGFDFFSLRQALENPGRGFEATIEFFPEEGKYHLDGHRKCGVCLEPPETRRLGAVCPACHRPLTVGVLHRVMELADRAAPVYPAEAPGVYSLIPLPEVLGELLQCGPATKTVLSQYVQVINDFGSEFRLYLETPLEEIGRRCTLLAEAVRRVRAGQVIRRGGYDGEFGVIRVFEEKELAHFAGQKSLFGGAPRRPGRRTAARQPPAVPISICREESSPPAAPAVLNPDQERVMASQARHLLVKAGPGTGKTFTLVERLGKLLSDEAVPARQVVAITFTNRAAAEVRNRLQRLAGPATDEVFVGTFHRFCLTWWRSRAPGLLVVGGETREQLLRQLFPAWDRARRESFQKELSRFYEHLSGARAESDTAELAAYQQELTKRGGVDLDGIIPLWVQRLQAEPELLAEMQAAVGFLLVDEFQDLNRSQYELVRLLARQARLLAIGDPDQAIYGFRGSDPRFFFELAGQPGTETMALSRNYRSAPLLLEAATAVISRNPESGRTPLTPQSSLAGRLEFYQAPSPAAEAEYVVRRIEEMMGGISHFSINSGRGGESDGGRSFGDFAVLFRLNRQAEILSEALTRRGIPFQQVGAVPFFNQGPLRGAYALAQAAATGSAPDHLALLARTSGIGRRTLEKLEQEIPPDQPRFAAAAARLDLAPAIRARLGAVCDLVRQLRTRAAAEGLAVGLQQAMAFLEIEAEQPAARRFLELAGAFGRDLEGFALHLEQHGAATVYDPRAEAVALMTLHAAKGLEFPVVFLTGLEEALLPCSLPGLAGDPAEERRLFYVGLTRARESLLLSAARERTLFGRTTEQQVSRFVSEIPARLVTRATDTATLPRKKRAGAQMRLF